MKKQKRSYPKQWKDEPKRYRRRNWSLNVNPKTIDEVCALDGLVTQKVASWGPTELIIRMQ